MIASANNMMCCTNDNKRAPLQDVSNMPSEKQGAKRLSTTSKLVGRRSFTSIRTATKTKVARKFWTSMVVAPRSLSKTEDTVVCDDVDTLHKSDPLCATEYVEDIHKTHREQESLSSVDPLYMLKHAEFNPTYRAIIVDWLVESRSQGWKDSDISTDTLYLAVTIMDRFLAKTTSKVEKTNLQLVGVTCFFIASKYEDIWPPTLAELALLCAGLYCPQDMINMEVVILKTLEYRISFPTANTFLAGYLKVAGASANDHTANMARYLLEGSLLSDKMLNFLPSQLAAAAVFLACNCSVDSWKSTLSEYTGYSYEMIAPVARAVWNQKVNTPCHLMAINKKYSAEEYDGVATDSLTHKPSVMQ